ncbi:MAG: helix-turn-helix domain-containing protein [Dehalococcoidales bacterium]
MIEERLTFTLPEACRLLGISRNLGYDLARRGEFPGQIHLGQKRVVVSRVQLEAFLAGKNRVEAGCHAG